MKATVAGLGMLERSLDVLQLTKLLLEGGEINADNVLLDRYDKIRSQQQEGGKERDKECLLVKERSMVNQKESYDLISRQSAYLSSPSSHTIVHLITP